MNDLNFLIFLSNKYNFDIVQEHAEYALNAPEVKTSHDYIESYTEEASKIYNMPKKLIRSKTRQMDVRVVRQVIMYICYLNKISSFKDIGLYFGGRDHSTAISAKNRVSDLLDCNDDLYLRTYNSLSHLVIKRK
jgi:chromosomal replication initiation ATPase DnaA